MGTFCARSMAVKNVLPDICFELFVHVTTFFGYKVGVYNFKKKKKF